MHTMICAFKIEVIQRLHMMSPHIYKRQMCNIHKLKLIYPKISLRRTIYNELALLSNHRTVL